MNFSETDLQQKVKGMCAQFGFNKTQIPVFTEEEKEFRYRCMLEEAGEYYESVTREDKLDALVDLLYFIYGTHERQYGFDNLIFKSRAVDYRTDITVLISEWFENPKLEALESCAGWVLATAVADNFSLGNFAVAFERVDKANKKKVLGSLPKRGDFHIDLRKPEGWSAPDLSDLV